MGPIDHSALREEAETCRRRALAYLGRPEATFLISAASAFDELAAREHRSDKTAEPTAG